MFTFFQKFLVFFLIFGFFSEQVFALPKISSLLPRPSSDIFREYIELQNPDCEAISLKNYRLENSRQQFIFDEEILEKNEKKRFFRKETKFALRDSGDTIRLVAPNGEIIDEMVYNSAKKDEIFENFYENSQCQNAENWEKNENSTNAENEEIADKIAENSENSENTTNEENVEKSENAENNEENNANEEDEKNENEENEENNFVLLQKIAFFDENDDGFFEKMALTFSENLAGMLNISDFSLKKITENGLEDVEKSDIFVSGNIDKNVIYVIMNDFLTEENIAKNTENGLDWIIIWTENLRDVNGISGGKIDKIDENSLELYEKIIKNKNENNEKIENIKEENNKNSENVEKTKNEIDFFPEIVPILQRSTTAVLRQNTLFCAENPCSVNLNFDTIFSEKFPKKNFSCQMKIDSEEYVWCNPPQMRFESEKTIIFTIKNTLENREKSVEFFVNFSEIPEKNDEKWEKPKKIGENISFANVGNAVKNREKKPEKMVENRFFPEIIITSDGKFQNAYEWLDDETISCFFNECSVNLNASDSYTKNDSSLRFEWKFGEKMESNKKNPPAVIFASGSHEIELTVTDNFGKISRKKIIVNVPEKSKNDEKTAKNEKIEKKIAENSENSEPDEEFEIPEIILQNPKNFVMESDEYFICQTQTATCSVNLSLSEAKKNFSYMWSWNDEEAFLSKNPRAKMLEIGKNTLVLQILNEKNDILATKNLTVEVQKITKTKAKKSLVKKYNSAKKAKQKSKKSKKIAKNSEKITKTEKPKSVEKVAVQTENNPWPLSLAGVLFSGLVLTRKRSQE